MASLPRLAGACGPFPIVPWFWAPPAFDHRLPSGAGLVMPGDGVRDLLATWRRLNGSGMPSELATALLSTAPEPPNGDAVEEWRRVRALQGGGLQVSPWRSIDEATVADGGGQRYLNCSDDAWRTAAATLRDRESLYGSGSVALRRWLAGQDQVFAACEHPATIPPDPDPSWAPLERADRAYQIAAARFYNGDYTGAAVAFTAVASDRSSPWREIAHYLVARTWIRRTSLAGCAPEECLTRATEVLREVAATAADAKVRRAAASGLGYTLARLQPATRRQEIAELLGGDSLPAESRLPDLRQAVADYEALMHGKVTNALWSRDRETPLSDPDRWIALLHVGSGYGAVEAANLWRQHPSAAWLLATLALGPLPDAPADDILAAAAEVPETSPAALSISYHHARWLSRAGERAAARGILDRLLADRSLTPEDRNRILDLRGSVSADLDDFAAHATMPLWIICDDTCSEDHDDRRSTPPWLGPAAVALIEHALPVDRWAALADNQHLPMPVRAHLAVTGWIRAVLAGEQPAAKELASSAKGLIPEMAGELEEWSAAPSSEARTFVAALIVLRRPGIGPTLRPGLPRSEELTELDSQRDNWWCAGGEALKWWLPPRPSRPAFAPPWPLDDQFRADVDEVHLKRVPEAPQWLTATVLAWAINHPTDPRVPEALHLSVRSTRFGCPDVGYGPLSRAAFALLHSRYGATAWAEKTPYWFD
ncbi:MAG TPA: hypothetical protein VGV61_08540 [Thermoanaerobaculia bacterium]|jgi:hypothetical protein|nr:hypothetical protein [Thermoanaerobaculia bacterium]